MNLEKTRNGSSLLVCVEGKIDTVTAPDFEAGVVPELDGVTELTVDFSKVTYISSAGLRVLLSLQKKMNNQGSMVIKGVNETVEEIFEVTGFSEILTIE